MTLPLTPETLAAAYDYLCTTPPFASYNLPDSEDVKFIVTKSRVDFSQYRWDGKQHTISVSEASVGHTATLMEKISHELLHLHLEQTGMESRGDENTHNAAFRKLAAQACRIHGWDLKAFY